MTPRDETAPNPSDDDEAVEIIARSLAANDDLPAFAGWQTRNGAEHCLAALRTAGFRIFREGLLADARTKVEEADRHGAASGELADRANEVIAELEAALNAAKEGWHYANGVADLAMKHRDEAEAALAAALAERDAARAKVEWRPIETAPRDGSPALVLQGAEQWVAKWMTAVEDGDGQWIIVRGRLPGSMVPVSFTVPAPTQWQPLPIPPDSALDQEREGGA